MLKDWSQDAGLIFVYNFVMQPDKSPIHIQNLFNEISPYYDEMNNFISLGLHIFVKKFAIKILNINKKSDILDICCGTGDFTKIIRKISPQSRIIGVDFSHLMIEKAKQKFPKEIFIQADCTCLPYKEDEFDYVTVGFGLRNVENRSQALNEIYRVLKSGGKFLHLDFEGSNNNFASKIFERLTPIIAKVFGKNIDNYRYLINSKNTYPPLNILVKEFENVGFKLISSKKIVFGVINAIVVKK